MKAFSSAVSIAVHVAIGAAVLFGRTNTGQTDPGRPHVEQIVFPPVDPPEKGDGMGVPPPIGVPPPPVIGQVSTNVLMPQTGPLIPSFSPAYSQPSHAGSAQPGTESDLVTEEHAEVLTGPLPVYPELLRQAGVQGRVVLEAVVDTTGRVLAASILVVSRTNPGFVAPARQALLATLFRPAMVAGTPVRMRVRIPYEFAIRNGIGRAR